MGTARGPEKKLGLPSRQERQTFQVYQISPRQAISREAFSPEASGTCHPRGGDGDVVRGQGRQMKVDRTENLQLENNHGMLETQKFTRDAL